MVERLEDRMQNLWLTLKEGICEWCMHKHPSKKNQQRMKDPHYCGCPRCNAGREAGTIRAQSIPGRES